MNVIFLDVDGVLNSYHFTSDSDVERRIKILADICHELNCKVVISAGINDLIDEETLRACDYDFIDDDTKKYVNVFLDLLKKYNVECIGRTPRIGKQTSEVSYIEQWKEYEIEDYLVNHPEINHFCILDDDECYPKRSWFDKLEPYLVRTLYYSDNPEEEGLLESYKEDIAKKLELENIFRKNKNFK